MTTILIIYLVVFAILLFAFSQNGDLGGYFLGYIFAGLCLLGYISISNNEVKAETLKKEVVQKEETVVVIKIDPNKTYRFEYITK